MGGFGLKSSDFGSLRRPAGLFDEDRGKAPTTKLQITFNSHSSVDRIRTLPGLEAFNGTLDRWKQATETRGSLGEGDP